MAQFDFYGDDRDLRELLRAVLEPGDVGLTPDLDYETDHPGCYAAADRALCQALKISPRVFVTGGFSDGPLRLEQIEDQGHARTYVIVERRGGPALSLSMPMCKRLDGKLLHLGAGDLFCHNVFWRDDDTAYKAPPEVKQAYVDLRNRIKSVVKRRRVGTENLWIGDGGFDLLNDGKALILINGSWVDAHGTFVKSNLSR